MMLSPAPMMTRLAAFAPRFERRTWRRYAERGLAHQRASV